MTEVLQSRIIKSPVALFTDAVVPCVVNDIRYIDAADCVDVKAEIYATESNPYIAKPIAPVADERVCMNFTVDMVMLFPDTLTPQYV